jgi:hypothetical protein
VGHLSEHELIRKVIEEWNPFFLEDSIYGSESYEIYKCIVSSNSQDNPQKIEICIQRILSGFAEDYSKVWNREFYIDNDKCLEIAKEITNLIEFNKNGDSCL